MTPPQPIERLVLYQYNEALMRLPYEDRSWDRWRELLEVVHFQAVGNPGYVGRYQGENDPLGYIAPRWPEEPLIMGALTCWRDARSLAEFTYRGTHGSLLKHREQWFETWPHERPHFVAWWARADQDSEDVITPRFDLDVAMLMQGELQQDGSTANVFGIERLRRALR